MLFHLKDFTSVIVLSVYLNWPPLDPEKTVLVFVNRCYESVVPWQRWVTIPSYPHVYFLVTGCYPSSGFGAVQFLHGRDVWVCVLQSLQVAAGSSRSQRCWYHQQGWGGRVQGCCSPQPRTSSSCWSRLGFFLVFLSVVANHWWGFPKMSWSVPVLEVCGAADSAAVHRVQNAPGILCRTGCTQEEGKEDWRPVVGTCSASDPPSCEHRLRLQAELSSWPSGTGLAAAPVLAAFCPCSLWHGCRDLPTTGQPWRGLAPALPSQGKCHLCWSASCFPTQLSLAVCMWDCMAETILDLSSSQPNFPCKPRSLISLSLSGLCSLDHHPAISCLLALNTLVQQLPQPHTHHCSFPALLHVKLGREFCNNIGICLDRFKSSWMRNMQSWTHPYVFHILLSSIAIPYYVSITTLQG